MKPHLLLINCCFILTIASSCRKDIINELEQRPYVHLPPQDYNLVWSDEFNDKELDLTKWNYRALGIRREGINARETITIDQSTGELVLKTFMRNDSAFSAMIGTQGLFEKKYGYFECKARVDFIGLGWWPAFWIHSRNFGKTLNTSDDGSEIDIFEFPSGNPYILDQVIHYHGYGPNHHYIINSTQSDAFINNQSNIYGFEWTPDYYKFYVNGRVTWEVSENISHTEQYMILSTEVGNKEAFFKNFGENGTEFRIDYVRVYEKTIQEEKE